MFDYKVVDIVAENGNAAKFEQELNHLGVEGWQLVNVEVLLTMPEKVVRQCTFVRSSVANQEAATQEALMDILRNFSINMALGDEKDGS